MRKALGFIEANLAKPLTVSDIAAQAAVSVRALQKSFRSEMGTSPVKYIIDRRLSEAHRELTSADKNSRYVSEVAYRWGFQHISDFTRRYRARYGETPTVSRLAASVKPRGNGFMPREEDDIP